ncbi:hypothetical protein AAFC00_001360 [Neodothiora populina]
MIALFVLETPFVVAALTLFAIAQPDTYRKRLWQDGADNGFNSSPNEVLYAYANHTRDKLKLPMVWDQFITDFNVVISVLSFFILVTKAIMFVMGTFLPLLSVVTHVAEVVLYIVSSYGQTGPDTSDPKHPQKGGPWYITKSCSVVHTKSNYGYCVQAKASFAVTLVLVILYAAYLGLAIFSSIPTRAERLAKLSSSDMPVYEPEHLSGGRPWGKQEPAVHLAPMSSKPTDPYTPRTVAFHTLEGGENGTNGKKLPFRERYGGDEEAG